MRYLAGNSLLNWSILLHVRLTLGRAVLGGHLAFVLPQILAGANLPLGLGLAGILLGLLLAIGPMIATARRMKAYYAAHEPLQALPGLTGWLLVLLPGAFAISPWAYLLWLFFWVTLQLARLRARANGWPYRELANSESSTDDYYSLKGELDPVTCAPRIYKRSNSKALWRRLFVLNYRYLVLLGPPISHLGLLLARGLKWTRVLGGLGQAIENALTAYTFSAGPFSTRTTRRK